MIKKYVIIKASYGDYSAHKWSISLSRMCSILVRWTYSKLACHGFYSSKYSSNHSITRSHSDGRTFTVKLSDVCAMKRDPGPCPGSALRWYYDAERGTCSQFVYGGCKGNANRFRSLAACQQRCPSQGIDSNEEKSLIASW